MVPLRELTAVADHDGLAGLAVAGAHTLDGLDHLHALGHVAEHLEPPTNAGTKRRHYTEQVKTRDPQICFGDTQFLNNGYTLFEASWDT